MKDFVLDLARALRGVVMEAAVLAIAVAMAIAVAFVVIAMA